MTYPTPPAPRIMYDALGAVAFYSNNVDGSGVRQVSPEWVRALNSDGPNLAVIDQNNWWGWDLGRTNGFVAPDEIIAVRFPYPMSIKAISAAFSVARDSWVDGSSFHKRVNFFVEGSTNSTNGVDGSWTLLQNYLDVNDFTYNWTGFPNNEDVKLPSELIPMETSVIEPGGSLVYRGYMTWDVFGDRRRDNDADGVGWREISVGAGQFFQWVRIRSYGEGSIVSGSTFGQTPFVYIAKLHLYGDRDYSAPGDELRFVGADGSPKPFFDFGDIHAGQVLTQQFRVKNISALIAEDVRVNALASNPTRSIPSPDSWCQLSADGGMTWHDEIVVSSLVSGASSDILTLRVTPLVGTYGPWSPRLRATVGSWS